MQFRLDTFTIVLTIIFVAMYAYAGQGNIDLGQYTNLILIAFFFSIFSYYDQFKRPYKKRNYILLAAIIGIYLGAGIGFLVSQDADGAFWGALIGLSGTYAVLWTVRKPFYAWLDQFLGQDEIE